MSIINQHCVLYMPPFSIYSSKYEKSPLFYVNQRGYYLSLDLIPLIHGGKNDFILHLKIQTHSDTLETFPVQIFVEDESHNIQFLQTTVADGKDMRIGNGQTIWRIKGSDIGRISESLNVSNLKFFLLWGKQFRWLNKLKMECENQTGKNKEDKFVQAAPEAKETENKMVQTAFERKKVACLENLSLDFSNLLHSEKETDITIVCKENNFAVHKSILSARSEVFAAMFRNDMSEKFSSCVEINDIDPAIMKIFLQYAYSGTLPEFTEDIALSLYTVAHKYAVAVLQRRCADFLTEIITESNACRNLLLFDRHNDDYFKRYVIEFIVKNDKIMSEDAWFKLCDENLKLSNEVYREHFKYFSANKKE